MKLFASVSFDCAHDWKWHRDIIDLTNRKQFDKGLQFSSHPVLLRRKATLVFVVYRHRCRGRGGARELRAACRLEPGRLFKWPLLYLASSGDCCFQCTGLLARPKRCLPVRHQRHRDPVDLGGAGHPRTKTTRCQTTGWEERQNRKLWRSIFDSAL